MFLHHVQRIRFATIIIQLTESVTHTKTPTKTPNFSAGKGRGSGEQLVNRVYVLPLCQCKLY